MNNLLETVWHENPVFLGAIAGSGAFEVRGTLNCMPIPNQKLKLIGYSQGKVRVQLSGLTEWISIHDCTLITRSIDSLTFEESCKIPSIQEEAETELSLVSLTDRTMWLNINIKLNRLSALDFFYLLSIGIWTGSKEGVEVIDG